MVHFGDKDLYRLDLYDYKDMGLSLKEDGSAGEYQMIFVIENHKGAVVGYSEETVKWTASSEAYYLQALEAGLISAQ